MTDYFECLKNTLKSGRNKSTIVEILDLRAAKPRERALEDFDNAFSRRCRLLQPSDLQSSSVA